MALLFPQPGDRGEPDAKMGRAGGSASAEERRVLRDGMQVLARGSLACPECSLPVLPAPRVRPRGELRCAFCEHSAAAIEFMHEDVADAPANAVALIARLA